LWRAADAFERIAGAGKGRGFEKAGRSGESTEAYRFNTLGVAHMNQQRPADAQKFFERALEADPKFAVARVNLGVSLMGQQNWSPRGRRWRARGSFPRILCLVQLGLAHQRDPQIHPRHGKFWVRFQRSLKKLLRIRRPLLIHMRQPQRIEAVRLGGIRRCGRFFRSRGLFLPRRCARTHQQARTTNQK